MRIFITCHRVFYLFMNIFHHALETVLEAIFPTPPAEKWLLSMDVESILRQLPRAKNMPIPDATSIFSYKDERVWRLVWSIKYKKSKRAVEVSAYALYKIILLYLTVVPKIILIPMPVSKQRRRERGFNQCELLTSEIGKLEVNKQLIIVEDLLMRKKNTSRQTLKDRKDRLKSAQELFMIHEIVADKLRKEKNAMIIIIDDVVTTGSTMKEAVHTMRNAGFTNTWGLSVAH